jgi:hypothetical protein
MKMNEFIKAIGALQNDANTQTFDLTTKEGYEGFKAVVKELRNSDTSLFDAFGIDINEWLDNVETLGKKLHESNKENKDRKEIVKDAVKQMDRKVIDHSEEEEEPEDEQKKEECEFKRPSELLTIPQKLQLHKLVQEYVDTTIKPFNKGVLTNNQINDAYAGLYEFGAWILNR